MTKELARNILTEHIRLMGDEPSLNEDKEALSMAIQALKRAERWEKHICFDCKYFSENEEEYDEKRCLKCTLIGTEWEQKK